MTSSEPRRGPPAGRVLFIIVLIDLVGFGIVLPLLPAYGAEFSESRVAIGILVASFSFMQFLLAPWWGRLSDRLGRRPVLLLGLGSSALSYVLLAVAGNFWLLLISRILAGGIGATVNVSQAYLADITPASGRARAMGIIGVAFGLGFIIGPAIAALTVQAGREVPGLVAAGTCVLSLAIGWRYLPETRVHRPATPRGPIPWNRVTAPYLVMLLTVIGFAAITVVFPLYTAESLGYDRRETSMLFVLMGVASAVVQGWLVGRLAPRYGERSLMMAGSLFLAAGLALVPLAAELPAGSGVPLPGLLLGVVLLAAGTGLAWPAVAGYISQHTDTADQGRALGALHSVASIARVIGPILVGVAGESGFAMAFGAGAVLSLAAMVAARFADQGRP